MSARKSIFRQIGDERTRLLSSRHHAQFGGDSVLSGVVCAVAVRWALAQGCKDRALGRR